MPFPTNSRMGNLLINPGGATAGEIQTAMRCPAWWVLDLSPMWGFPQLRGADVVVPGASGRRTYRRRIDETLYLMPMRITGEVTASGAASGTPSNAFQGLRDNLDYLFENVVTPPTGGTRTARLVLPDASTLDDDIHVTIELGEQSIIDVRAVLRVTVPSGRFGGG